MQSIVLNSAVINYTVYFTDTNELLVRTKNGEEITLTHVLPEEFVWLAHLPAYSGKFGQ